MTPAERATKITELRAEADRLERGWPDKIERGMVFQQMATKEVYIMSGRNRLVCVTDGGEWSGDQGFSNRENDFTYLGHARDLLAIKTPDEEPTGAELVGKVCVFCDSNFDTFSSSQSECRGFGPRGYQDQRGVWWRNARLHKEQK